MSNATLTTGLLAKRAGVGVETIRYYERIGLLPPPARSSAGYRQFPADAVDRFRFIRQAKNLGFSLQEIRELLSLRVEPEASCAEVRLRAEAKIGEIHKRVRGLQRMSAALRRLTEACAGRGSTSACPILEALESPEDDDRPEIREHRMEEGLDDE
jgi:Hg(II)-responsive transcriptional regulator